MGGAGEVWAREVWRIEVLGIGTHTGFDRWAGQVPTKQGAAPLQEGFVTVFWTYQYQGSNDRQINYHDYCQYY